MGTRQLKTFQAATSWPLFFIHTYESVTPFRLPIPISNFGGG